MLNRRVSLVVSFIHCCCCLVRKKNVEVWVTQLCPTLWDPMDCSPPGSSVHGILQARILEWVAISFSRGSSPPRMKPMSHALQADSLPLNHLGSPLLSIVVYICQSQSLNSSYPPLPRPHPHLVSINLFSTSGSLFLLCKYIHVYLWLFYAIYSSVPAPGTGDGFNQRYPRN